MRSRTHRSHPEAARLIKRFQQCYVDDHRGMSDIIASMKEVLVALDGGTVANDTDYSLDDLGGRGPGVQSRQPQRIAR